MHNLVKTMKLGFHFVFTCGIIFVLACSFLPVWEIIFSNKASQIEKLHALPYTVGSNMKIAITYVNKEIFK